MKKSRSYVLGVRDLPSSHVFCLNNPIRKHQLWEIYILYLSVITNSFPNALKAFWIVSIFVA